MGKQIVHSNKSVFNVGYHLIWCPKYRKKILTKLVEYKLKGFLFKKAKELGVFIKAIEIMPDHIHLFVKANPKLQPNLIVKHFKGFTSYMLRKEFPFLKKLPVLWTRGYYCETIGHISEKTIRQYIKNQKVNSIVTTLK